MKSSEYILRQISSMIKIKQKVATKQLVHVKLSLKYIIVCRL